MINLNFKLPQFLFLFYIISQISMAQNLLDLKQLEWIADDWINTENDAVTHEHWEKINDSLIEGGSETIKNGDTVFAEKLKIILKDGDIFYVADVSHNPAPVYFKLTESIPGKAVFENPEHDFPKKITYELEDGSSLHAIIEGPGKACTWKKVDFYFTRRR
jgi:hypothetical protein